jgi:glutathione S-transferase
MHMLKVLGRANSINVQKVLWICDELSIPFDREDLGGGFGGLDTPEYRRKNPNGLVPTIDDDGVIVWESNTIVRYLAARYGAGLLWPEDPAVRAESDKWMDWQLTTYWPDVRNIFLQIVRTPEVRRNAQVIEEARVKAIGAAMALNTALEGKEFLVGNTLTIGDIAVGVVAYRFFALDFEKPSLPHLESWYARLADRPAFQRQVMLPLT